MKYGVVSDIHANLQALDAVCARLDAARVERVICLGDTVGYHADPNACVARVRARCDLAIAGNHDRAVTGSLDASDFPFIARRAVAWTRRELDVDHRTYLAALPILARLDSTTCLVHGALAPQPNDLIHISTPARISSNLVALAQRDETVCWFGHTHRPVVHTWRGGRVASHPAEGTLAFAPDTRYLINPGSVGQPRDGDARAAFAIVDTDRQTVTFERVEFDLVATRRRAEAAGLLDPPNFARRSYEAARSRWLDARTRVRGGMRF